MNEVKPHLSYERQINKLREKGCIIDDDSFCRDVLVNIGYYRLSAYFLPFKSFDGTYMDNLSFERVYRVYEFDRKLRNLLFSAIEVIEVSLRTRLAHFHSENMVLLDIWIPLHSIQNIMLINLSRTLTVKLKTTRKFCL